MRRLTTEQIKAETLHLHDLYYGNAHCERKWVEICPQYQGLIFEAGNRLRSEKGATDAEQDQRAGGATDSGS